MTNNIVRLTARDGVVPYGALEAGSLDVIRTDAKGYVHAPPGDGLGIRVDWSEIKSASLISYELSTGSEAVAIRGKGTG